MKDYSKFNFTNNDYMILVKTEHYTKTISGKSWRSHPDAVTTEIFTPEQYTNFVTAAPWFNKFFRYDFNGNRTAARCTITCGYTAAGYLPTGSTNINPDASKKTVSKLEIINKRKMMDAAGYREADVLQNADRWSYNYNNGYDVYTFYHKDGEHDAEWSMKLNRWIG